MLAQEEARILGCDQCNAEHILLGLLGQGTGIAARALKKLGLSHRDVRKEVKNALGNRAVKPWFRFPTKSKPMLFGEQSKKVFQLSLDAATARNEAFIDTYHLLFALLELNEGTAKEILELYRLDINKVKQTVSAMQG